MGGKWEGDGVETSVWRQETTNVEAGFGVLMSEYGNSHSISLVSVPICDIRGKYFCHFDH